MKDLVIGIDLGGSTTKIVGFRRSGELLAPLIVKASDQFSAAAGALGSFLHRYGARIEDVSVIRATGVGSHVLSDNLLGIPCSAVLEFEAIGRGGLHLSGLAEAVVLSIGTGTAIVCAQKDSTKHAGGTGVGGGTALGLSKAILGVSTYETLVELSRHGDCSTVDLRIADIAANPIGGLALDVTAANFGKMSDGASREDIAAAIINLVLETGGNLASFAARISAINTVVVTGRLTSLPQAGATFAKLSKLFGIDYVIPPHAQFATAIGAALIARAERDNA